MDWIRFYLQGIWVKNDGKVHHNWLNENPQAAITTQNRFIANQKYSQVHMKSQYILIIKLETSYYLQIVGDHKLMKYFKRLVKKTKRIFRIKNIVIIFKCPHFTN